MNGPQAIEYIHSFYGQGKKAGLANARALMEQLGNPHERLKCVHVAGTNGKGSICAYIESALRTQGNKTGLYTSPYLQRFNERIRVNGVPIADDDLGEAVTRVKEAIDKLHKLDVYPTEFEIGTAAAFLWFAIAEVDYAVIEVGIGGRLDTTNIITPLISVIGNIGLDHEKLLGDTVEQIASEKAGIIKPGKPVVLYPQQESVRAVVENYAREQGAKFIYVDENAVNNAKVDTKGADYSYLGYDVRVNIPGKHQVFNSATALAALVELRRAGVEISDFAITEGIRRAFWAGRLEWVGDNILIDGAHNPQGAASLADFVQENFFEKRVALVFGVQRQKPYMGIAEQFARFAGKVFAVEPDSHRALPTDELAAIMSGHGVAAETVADVAGAIRAARSFAGDDGLVVIAGSLYLAGEARTLLLGDGGVSKHDS